MHVTHGADHTQYFDDMRLELWRLHGRGPTARYRLVLTRRTPGRRSGERYRNDFREADFRDLGHMVAGLYWSLKEIFPKGGRGACAAAFRALLEADAPVSSRAPAPRREARARG